MSSGRSPCKPLQRRRRERFGLMRHLEWDGFVYLVFCSFLCEFLWRRDQMLDRAAATAAGIAVLAITALMKTLFPLG